MPSSAFEPPAGALPEDVDVVTTGAEALSRNREILSEREQAALRTATVLVAGCGGGSSVIEPLVRLGVVRLRVADPDRFDVSNLNRQACVLADVGRPKTEVVADRARAINPSAEVTEYRGGLTLENLDEALDGAHIAFDAIDPQMSAWVKYQLHERAARRGIPVISAMDFGGKPIVYVFDYRRNAIPFYGKATAEAHRESRVWDSMRWVGRTHFPTDYLPVMADRFTNGGTFPQITYCVTGLSALFSRTVLDLLMNRRTRHVITVDLHASVMPRAAAFWYQARMPVELARMLKAVRRGPRHIPAAPPAHPLPPRPIPVRLATVLEGARRAPSAYNAQPWRFELSGDRTIRLAPDVTRWPCAEPLGWAESLGCALGTMTYLAHGEWEPNLAEPDGPEWFAGQFHVDRLRDDVLARQGAVGMRATHRGDMLRTPLDGTTVKRLETLCSQQNLTLETVTATAALDRPGPRDTANLQAWLRDRARTEEGRRSFGDPHDLLGGARHPLARVARLVSRSRTRGIRACGAVLILRGPRRTVADRLNAGAVLVQVWLALTEGGYVAQPLFGEFAGSTPPVADRNRDGEVLAVLRAGRATTTPPGLSNRCSLENSVRWQQQ
jgi:molybdopterin/thiamine biosynthesis adenylyltransferase